MKSRRFASARARTSANRVRLCSVCTLSDAAVHQNLRILFMKFSRLPPETWTYLRLLLRIVYIISHQAYMFPRHANKAWAHVDHICEARCWALNKQCRAHINKLARNANAPKSISHYYSNRKPSNRMAAKRLRLPGNPRKTRIASHLIDRSVYRVAAHHTIRIKKIYIEKKNIFKIQSNLKKKNSHSRIHWIFGYFSKGHKITPLA